MANEVDEQRIRERAYHLWQQDGAPEGRPDEYWEKARNEILAESSDTDPSSSQSRGRDREDPVSHEDKRNAGEK